MLRLDLAVFDAAHIDLAILDTANVDLAILDATDLELMTLEVLVVDDVVFDLLYLIDLLVRHRVLLSADARIGIYPTRRAGGVKSSRISAVVRKTG